MSFRSPGIDSEKSIPPAYIASRSSTKNRVIVPDHQAGNRFLGSLIGLQIPALYSLAATPQLPQHLGSYTRALLVSQDRRHLFVTPCKSYSTGYFCHRHNIDASFFCIEAVLTMISCILLDRFYTAIGATGKICLSVS